VSGDRPIFSGPGIGEKLIEIIKNKKYQFSLVGLWNTADWLLDSFRARLSSSLVFALFRITRQILIIFWQSATGCAYSMILTVLRNKTIQNEIL
jgi:hypothetical protein